MILAEYRLRHQSQQRSRATTFRFCRSFPLFCMLASPFWMLHIVSDLHAEDKPIDFAQEVRPIFDQHCARCHDANRQRSGFRLDVRSAAMRGGDNFSPAILPENSEESPLIRIISGEEEGFRMPPEGELLSADQIQVLRRWIDEGAHWPDELSGETTERYWAFQPVQRHPVPTFETAQSQSPVDAFLLQKLVDQHLSFSLPTDQVTLLRRATFDLLGLPPSQNEVADFIADDRPDAYERLLDRLLASPHFGERYARHWLDVVRFAESNGFEMNQHRPNAWPYRDYVIDAFNSDKPYDQFVREQIAGDVFGADAGTGFLVGGPWDQVKSPDIGLTLQQRADELNDMVSTTGSAFFGLTVGCARCHNHKFDPITQFDYHALKAALSGVQHGERSFDLDDSPDRKTRLPTLQTQLADVDHQLLKFEPTVRSGRTILIDDEPDGANSEDEPRVMEIVPRNGTESYHKGTERGQSQDAGDVNRLPNFGRGYSFWKDIPDQNVFAWQPRQARRFQIWVSWGIGQTHATDVRYLIDHDGELSTTSDQREIGRVNQQQFCDGQVISKQQSLWSGLYSLGVQELTRDSLIILRAGGNRSTVTADVMVLQEVSENEELSLPRLRSAVRSNAANVERIEPHQAKYMRFTVLAVNTPSEPCLDEVEIWTSESSPRNVALSAHGTQVTSSGNFADGSLHRLEKINDGIYGNGSSWISNTVGQGWVQWVLPRVEMIDRIVWSRDRDGIEPNYTDRTATKYRIEVSLDGQTWLKVASSSDRIPSGWTTAPVQSPPDFTADQRQIAFELRAQQKKLRQEIDQLQRGPVAYLGKMGTPEPVNRLQRGDPLQPREAVLPGGIQGFGPTWELAAESTDAERRCALAEWIVDPTQPLTARVMVNRLWQAHFGQGIVSTPSDFGKAGALPSHAELLDWLATELVHHEWSLKSLHRQMLESQAYRQASTASAEGLQRDASARLLWRYPPRRLEAEPLRDTILAISGNLDDRMGGPGFDLFEPNNNYVKVYNSRKTFGPAEWRRMIYQSKPRMQLDDTFGLFDCPDAGQIAPKRLSSTTALQALNLLNSRFIVEQSEIFAQRLSQEAGTDPKAQIRLAYRLAFYRKPSEDELSEAESLVREHGLSSFCRAILNANELLYVF